MNTISKSEIDKVFGEIFRNFRLKNKLTQEQISEKIGISLKYISRIENGVSGIKTQTLINYMNSLGIAPNIIFKSFITNEKIKAQISLSEKISTLEENDIAFIENMIDLLKDFKGQNL